LVSVAMIVGCRHDTATGAKSEEAVRAEFAHAIHSNQSTPSRERESQVSAARSQPYYLDVTHPDANKGAVVLALSKMLAIPTEQIATIGDMPNDTTMFAKSGLSIAMGQSIDEVKGAATYVTTSTKEKG